MRVLIDAHMIGLNEGGNGTYMAGLIQGLSRDCPSDNLDLIALFRRAHSGEQDKSGLRVQRLAVLSEWNVKRLFFEIPRWSRRLGVDVVHLTYNAPLWLRQPVVLSVHDVIFRRYPEYFSPRDRLLFSTLLPLSMRRARAILTLSEASRREIVRFYPSLAEKVRVVPPAVGPAGSVEPDYGAADEIVEGREFILTVGTLQPRKNLQRLLRAYFQLREQGAIDSSLVIAGGRGWRESQIRASTEHSPFGRDVIFTGFLQPLELAGLYRRCLLCAYPSIYEGFGFPVLEAMACGAPVITSNTSSLPEVAGEAAILVDPHSTEQIAASIERLANDDLLREELRAKGFEQAARFSWEKTAQKAIEAYRFAANPNG